MVLARRPEQNVILILNRQKTQNFILPFDEIKNCQVENGFLMISRTDGIIPPFILSASTVNQRSGLWILVFFAPGEPSIPVNTRGIV